MKIIIGMYEVVIDKMRLYALKDFFLKRETPNNSQES
jgi:hypothetical protein